MPSGEPSEHTHIPISAHQDPLSVPPLPSLYATPSIPSKYPFPLFPGLPFSPRANSPAHSIASAITSLTEGTSIRSEFDRPLFKYPTGEALQQLISKPRTQLNTGMHAFHSCIPAPGLSLNTFPAHFRPSKFLEIESELAKWLYECRDKKVQLTDLVIRNLAKEVAKQLQILEDKFKASSGWVENFKHRYGIRRGQFHRNGRNTRLGRLHSVGVADSTPHFGGLLSSIADYLVQSDLYTVEDTLRRSVTPWPGNVSAVNSGAAAASSSSPQGSDGGGTTTNGTIAHPHPQLLNHRHHLQPLDHHQRCHHCHLDLQVCSRDHH
jgi:Tc5 transposase DNA-binding domain